MSSNWLISVLCVTPLIEILVLFETSQAQCSLAFFSVPSPTVSESYVSSLAAIASHHRSDNRRLRSTVFADEAVLKAATCVVPQEVPLRPDAHAILMTAAVVRFSGIPRLEPHRDNCIVVMRSRLSFLYDLLDVAVVIPCFQCRLPSIALYVTGRPQSESITWMCVARTIFSL